MDFVSIKTYNLHGSSDGVVGHTSALFPATSEKGDARRNNVVCKHLFFCKDRVMFLYNAVSDPYDHSKRFTFPLTLLHTVYSKTIQFLWDKFNSDMCN